MPRGCTLFSTFNFLGDRLKNTLNLVVASLLLTLLVSGCTPANTESTLAESGTLVIPNPAENSDHGYLLEDNRIPSILTCEEWEEFWVFEGPALSFAIAEAAANSEIAVSTQIYIKNKLLDKNQDGILCYFEDISLSASASSAITPVSDLSPAAECKIESTISGYEQKDSGFPRSPDYTVPTDGKIVIQLIYVEAQDLEHNNAPEKDVGFWIDGTGQFLTDVTDGKIQFEWRFVNKYFKLPRSFESFSMTREKQGNPVAFVQAAITASDSEIDFTEVDMVIAVPPPEITRELIDFSPALPLDSSNGFRTSEGNVYRGTLAGADTRWEEGYLLIAHEIGHLLGLEDYYSHEWEFDDPYEEQFKFMGEFDNMNSAAGKAREWTGWSRWLLGTLNDSQIRCNAGAEETTHQLWAISDSASEPKIVVVPISPTSAIVVESRKTRRHDRMLPQANEGLLVYIVDTKKPNGSGPLNIVRKDNLQDPFLLDAPLRLGESVTVNGYKIENIETGKLWDVAKITRVN